MTRSLLLALSAAGLIGWAAPSMATGLPIAGVEIESGVVELEGSEAGSFWTDLDTDLAAAIDSRLDGRLGGAGAHVRVRIDRVALNNAFEMMRTEGVPVLEGRVTVIGPTRSDSQLVRATGSDGVSAPESDPSNRYGDLVDAFADGVVAVLD